jgi:hypothetical protein
VLGTVQQFARSLDLSRHQVLRFLRETASDPIVLHAGDGRDRLLILDACSFADLLDNAGAELHADTSIVSFCT